MSDAVRLLEQIEEQILAHGGDLGGWTHLADGALQLFDGRVTLTVVIPEQVSSSVESVHIHVLTRLHDYDEEILEACLVGMGDNREESLRQAAGIWVTAVAGPIRSFLDGTPVCTTCQAGVAGGDLAQGFSEADYGLSGLRAYVGPVVVRGQGDGDETVGFSDNMPWFRFAGESAAPRRVHLAKTTVVFQSARGWCRELEVDGHEVSYQDYDWPSPGAGPAGVYATRFAVFEFPRNSTEMRRRMELDRTIRHFADNLAKHGAADQLAEQMVEQGFDAEIVREVEAISPIAFGRALFEGQGFRFSPTIIRARRDGRVETEVLLMSLPAFARARALAEEFRSRLSKDDFIALCVVSAESQAIIQALDAGHELTEMSEAQFEPCVVADRGVSDETFNAAMAQLKLRSDPGRAGRKKPWWKFW